MEISYRNRKKTQMKFSIVDAFLKAMEEEPLTQIKVEDISKRLGITKVTFFNYFSSKESVVEYFIRMWTYDAYYWIVSNDLRGIEGLKYLFDRIADHAAALPIMDALIHHYVKRNTLEIPEIPDFELCQYNEKAFEEGFRPIDIVQVLQYIIHDIDASERHRLTEVLMAGFFGIPLTCTIMGTNDLKRRYADFLNYTYPY